MGANTALDRSSTFGLGKGVLMGWLEVRSVFDWLEILKSAAGVRTAQARWLAVTFAVALAIGCSGDESADEVTTSQTRQALLQGDTFFAQKDSYVSKSKRNRNHGDEPTILIGGAGQDKERTLVTFNLSDVPITVTRATLVFTLQQPPASQPPDRCVDDADNKRCRTTILAQLLQTTWTEGQSQGPGVTWDCATDDDIANFKPECQTRWEGGLPARPPTAPAVVVTAGQQGEVHFDVTQDVLNGARLGWLLSSIQDAGLAHFYSREGAQAAGNLNLAPRLVLENPRYTVDNSGGCIRANANKVELCIPPGALSQPVTITITPTPIESMLTGSGLVPGTLYEFLPRGLQFAVPATLSIVYDPALVPATVPAESLILLSSIHGVNEELTADSLWEERPSTADTATARVRGSINHFSHDGVGEPAIDVFVFEAGVPGTQLTHLTAFVGEQSTTIALPFGQSGIPLEHVVDWMSANTNVATVDVNVVVSEQQGLVSGIAVGQTTVTATVRNSPPTQNASKTFAVTVEVRPREVKFVGRFNLHDDDGICCDPDDETNAQPFLRVCNLDAANRQDVIRFEHCLDDEVHLYADITCRLLDDAGNISVHIDSEIYEDTTCCEPGREECGDREDFQTRDFSLAPNATMPLFLNLQTDDGGFGWINVTVDNAKGTTP